jgi:hypothetical protein
MCFESFGPFGLIFVDSEHFSIALLFKDDGEESFFFLPCPELLQKQQLANKIKIQYVTCKFTTLEG